MKSPELPDPESTANYDADATASYDAGATGCGELVLELRFRLADLPRGAVLHLIATDPGAPEDLPSWCRMTGHRLRRAEPPHFWIERS